MAGLALAIALSAPAQAQDADPQVMTNLVIQVQELQDEVRTLRGILEEQARELENLKRRQRDQYLDLDQRVSGIQGGQPAGLAPAAAGGYVAQTSPQVAPPRDEPEVRDPMVSPSQTTGIVTSTRP